MAHEAPGLAVEPGVQRARRPEAGDPQPHRVVPDDERVRVVGAPVRDDRDDHRLALGRHLEGELHPAALARPQEQGARIERARERAAHAGRELEVALDGTQEPRCGRHRLAARRVVEEIAPRRRGDRQHRPRVETPARGRGDPTRAARAGVRR